MHLTFVLPPTAGFRVGESEQAISHVVLEVHYDNPQLDEGIVDEP